MSSTPPRTICEIFKFSSNAHTESRSAGNHNKATAHDDGDGRRRAIIIIKKLAIVRNSTYQ